MISPGKRLCGVASPDWGTAVVQLPWYIYLYFGNEEPLHKYYQEMKQWVDHVESLTLNDTLSTKHIVPYGLGDWCMCISQPTTSFSVRTIRRQTMRIIEHCPDR